MIELIKEINKILEMLNFAFDFMKDFRLWDNGGEFLPPLFKEDFIPIAFKKDFINLKGEEETARNDGVFENLFFKKNNQDILSEFFTVLKINNNEKPFSFIETINQVPEAPFNMHSSIIPFLSFIIGNNAMLPELDFIENIAKEKFVLDEILDSSTKNRPYQNSAFSNTNKQKNIINYLDQKEENAFKDFDIDLVGEELAKYIEQASINRSIADAY